MPISARRPTAVAFALLLVAAVSWKLGLFVLVDTCVRAFAWPAELIALHVVADTLVATAYVWIPIVLVLIWLRLKARPEATLLWLFGAFIVLCGWTHANEVAAIWWPAYWYTGAAKLVTGVVSIATAVRLTILFPRVVALGSLASDLQAAKDEAEMLRRAADARAERAEGDVCALEAAQAELRQALDQAEQERGRAERLSKEALESARTAQAARQQAEGAIADKLALQRAVTGLTTPVLPLWKGILLSPLVGTLDSTRMGQLVDVLLAAVCERQAGVVILDVSGVEIVDSAVADALISTCAAVKLLGGRCIITGIRPAVAQTMVQQRIDMPDIQTENTLELGLSAAMQLVRA